MPSSPDNRNTKSGLVRVNSISGRPLTDAVRIFFKSCIQLVYVICTSLNRKINLI